MILSSRRFRALFTPARSAVLLSSLAALAVGAGVVYRGHERVAPVAQLQNSRDWVGQLADVSASPKTVQADKSMTSASLVVPNATLALPAMPARAIAPKPRPCGAAPCPTGQVAMPPITRQKLPAETIVAKAEPKVEAAGAVKPDPLKPDLKPNPLARVADVVRQPFGYASDTIAGWIKRL